VSVKIPELLLADLIKDAQRQTFHECRGEDAWVGEDGNYDDTYSYGWDDGNIHQARTILDQLGISYATDQ